MRKLIILLMLPLFGNTQSTFNITIDSNNKWPGNIFFQRGGLSPKPVMIIDTSNTVTFSENWGLKGWDFKVNKNNKISYYDRSTKVWFVMDSVQNEIDSIGCQNGYIADNHDFIALSNGNYILFAYDEQPYAMDTVVPGGDPNANVEGLIIQELDSNHNVIFEWKSWDHFHVTDCTRLAPWTASQLQFIHANAIDIDFDGNLLLSSRNLDEITKIDRTTGDIIWRFGGAKNEFTFINDYPFTAQHSIQSLGNNKYLLFDNGSFSSQYTGVNNFSRAVEYQLDTISMTATQTWQFVHPDSLYSASISSVQRLPNGNTFIDFGNLQSFNLGSILTEVDSNNQIVFQLEFDNGYNLYRAKKFNWNFYAPVASPKTFVPDDSFETFLENNNIGDGILSNDSVFTNNIVYEDTLLLSSLGINDLTGIEDFLSLIRLNFSDNNLTNIDLSQNILLQNLDCSNNQLVNLDLSNNSNLIRIILNDNFLTEIDLTNNLAATRLVCYNNLLDSLNLTLNTSIVRLISQNNQLKNIDLSNNINLQRINLSDNLLESLDVRNNNNTSINFFNAFNNQNLSCIDVDDPTYSYNFWLNNAPLFSFDTLNISFSDNCGVTSNVGEINTERKLIKKTDLLGRKTDNKNQPLIYFYDDGTVEKKVIIE